MANRAHESRAAAAQLGLECRCRYCIRSARAALESNVPNDACIVHFEAPFEVATTASSGCSKPRALSERPRRRRGPGRSSFCRWLAGSACPGDHAPRLTGCPISVIERWQPAFVIAKFAPAARRNAAGEIRHATEANPHRCSLDRDGGAGLRAGRERGVAASGEGLGHGDRSTRGRDHVDLRARQGGDKAAGAGAHSLLRWNR